MDTAKAAVTVSVLVFIMLVFPVFIVLGAFLYILAKMAGALI